ncbi:YpmS family protein [Peribacillus kribbensis]|uniref:YpmS family protein n=1 Tax=Peribacillus kribbensis TaxID=356658 RepID=UPI00040E07F4|nr:YpmS family protein [Peribacillus kribbensis]
MKIKNKWKILFFSLLGLNILIVLILMILIYKPNGNERYIQKPSAGDDAGFTIHTNKKDLNVLINRYLDQEGLRGGISYDVELKQDVELYGTVPVFGRDLELKMTFKPKALKNGDLLLQQKSVSVGSMKLPVAYVLSMVSSYYKTPEWVVIQPDEKLIYVSLQNMDLKSNIEVKAKKFDLKNDDIIFRLTIPPDGRKS